MANSKVRDTISLPRILCLHGGGSNSEICTAQLRSFIRHMPNFRFVFADAPLASEAGPGVLPVYEEFGPYRRWLSWRPDHPVMDHEAAKKMIFKSIQDAKDKDHGTGPWVGILGFSQGARVATSILYDQQVQKGKLGSNEEPEFKFGILFAGRGPLVSFSNFEQDEFFAQAGAPVGSTQLKGICKNQLRLPTIHVHGLQDPDIRWQRKFLEQYCEPRSAKLFVWDGDHRIPYKDNDVTPIVDEIYRIARDEGVYVRRY